MNNIFFWSKSIESFWQIDAKYLNYSLAPWKHQAYLPLVPLKFPSSILRNPALFLLFSCRALFMISNGFLCSSEIIHNRNYCTYGKNLDVTFQENMELRSFLWWFFHSWMSNLEFISMFIYIYCFVSLPFCIHINPFQ